MIDESHYRPTIPPVTNEFRPLWSVMIPTYNCAIYLRETLSSVLAQDPGPEMMQIAVIDDHSSDHPEAVVEELGKGRVEFYRQPQNVGVPKNFQTCLEKSRGFLVHQLHGDDLVREGFYQKMQQVFEQHPEIGAAFCRTIIINQQGHWQFITRQEDLEETGVLSGEWLQEIVRDCIPQTPAMVVRREVYEKWGGFDLRLRVQEDWEMWVRIAANYPIAHEVEPLALYRILPTSNHHSNLTNGRMAEGMYRMSEIIESYLGDRIPTATYRYVRQNAAFSALQAADASMDAGNFTDSLTKIKAAIKYRSSFKVLRSAGRIILWNGTLCLLEKILLPSLRLPILK